jgi:hypothetical protein
MLQAAEVLSTQLGPRAASPWSVDTDVTREQRLWVDTARPLC